MSNNDSTWKGKVHMSENKIKRNKKWPKLLSGI